jgi:hypothetical protein
MDNSTTTGGPPSGMIPPDISMITGAPFVGIMMNWCLMGILCVQLYIYHLNFWGKDRKILQALAYGLFVLDLLQTGLATWDGFQWFVFGWGTPSELNVPYSAPINSPFIDAFTALVVQAYYCWRIYILSRIKWWPVILLLLALLQAASGAASGVLSAIVNDFSKIHDAVAVVGTIFMASAALVDTLIAASTTYLLLRRADHRPKQVDFMITKIVTLIVETNILTAGVALVALVMFVAYPSRNWFLAPLYILGKLYSTSLLVMFNTRITLHQGVGGSHSEPSVSVHRFQPTMELSSMRDDRRPPQPANMLVRVEKSTLSDAFPLPDSDEEMLDKPGRNFHRNSSRV